MIKYADKITTEGNRPPQMDLPHINAGSRSSTYPINENTSPKNQMMMKFSARASPLIIISHGRKKPRDTGGTQRGGDGRFCAVVLDELGH